MGTCDRRPVLDITVFILSYNRPQYLREMLLSVLGQTCMPEEILVLDNGSTEGTREAVADLIGGRVRWIGADCNHGSSWNFQRAYDMAKRKYLVLLHDDDRVLPGFLERTVGTLESTPDLIALTTGGYRINGRGERSKRPLLRMPPSTKVLLFKDSKDMALQYSHSFIPFPNIVYRNGYHQRVETKGEFGKVADCIFVIDLAGLGHMGVLNEMLFEYRVHRQQDSAYFPEDIMRMKEDYILSLFQGDDRLPTVLDNVKLARSRRLARCMADALLWRNGGPRALFLELSTGRYRDIGIRPVVLGIAMDTMVRLVLSVETS